ncbi:TetR family transcriptional regulator [Spongiactinospora rosea]|uniref:TetR family transcriptional regulator n=1 Tax=Spongiactinospora rosea TaxID=2248750 RepID=A0A366LL27_9ACTN|nr:TetR family transcriptional regulator [Spongiactinospora rosea]RBQ14527.1 TetR family transcriptional regulator [Spongiactinospora rosea]
MSESAAGPVGTAQEHENGAATRRRPGRRPGTADTRGQILAAASKIFAEKGFDKATIRGIAREAEVDPALVHHYFESKEGVFVAAMRLPADPGQVVTRVLEGPRDRVGYRLVKEILTVTAEPAAREPILALMRTAMTNEQALTMIREFITRAILGRVMAVAGVPPMRMEAAFSQIFGMLMMRYIVRLEPLASADIDEVAELVGPSIQRYMTGD